jgi:hypothetical protein
MWQRRMSGRIAAHVPTDKVAAEIDALTAVNLENVEFRRCQVAQNPAAHVLPERDATRMASVQNVARVTENVAIRMSVLERRADRVQRDLAVSKVDARNVMPRDGTAE